MIRTHTDNIPREPARLVRVQNLLRCAEVLVSRLDRVSLEEANRIAYNLAAVEGLCAEHMQRMLPLFARSGEMHGPMGSLLAWAQAVHLRIEAGLASLERRREARMRDTDLMVSSASGSRSA